MTRNAFAASLSWLVLLHCAPAAAQTTWSAAGSLVDVSVVIDGRTAPLYPAPDGSGRTYLEARAGAAYEVRIDNRSHERVGVVLSVDGLNAVSGERDRSLVRPGDTGRMYVLEAWEGTTVRGWRSSLSDVHAFTFVDEASSYAARSGKANPRMGWVEVAVYREQRPYVRRPPRPVPITPYEAGRDEARAMPAPPASAAPGTAAEASREAADRVTSDGAMEQKRHEEYGRSHPGTGWGRREWDPAVVVEFHPQSAPAERITLRYEYAQALARLGILRRPFPPGDRLWERERGRDGFAKPPGR